MFSHFVAFGRGQSITGMVDALRDAQPERPRVICIPYPIPVPCATSKSCHEQIVRWWRLWLDYIELNIITKITIYYLNWKLPFCRFGCCEEFYFDCCLNVFITIIRFVTFHSHLNEIDDSDINGSSWVCTYAKAFSNIIKLFPLTLPVSAQPVVILQY